MLPIRKERDAANGGSVPLVADEQLATFGIKHFGRFVPARRRKPSSVVAPRYRSNPIGMIRNRSRFCHRIGIDDANNPVRCSDRDLVLESHWFGRISDRRCRPYCHIENDIARPANDPFQIP